MRLCPDCGTPRPRGACPHCNSTSRSGAVVLGATMLAIGLSACSGESETPTETPEVVTPGPQPAPDIEQATIYGAPDSFGLGPGPLDPAEAPPVTPEEEAPSDPDPDDPADDPPPQEEAAAPKAPRPENIRAIYGLPPSSHLEAPKKE